MAAVLPLLLSLSDASNESVTNNYSAFPAAADERKACVIESSAEDVKVASCSFENARAHLDREKAQR